MQQYRVGIAGITLLTTIACTSDVAAQLIPDDTQGGESSVITPDMTVNGNPADLIEGGAQRDSSLFHSFLEFNIDDGQQVYFANPAGILNIFSRITGDNPSNIFGTLGVDGYANLFFINPNGIVFGPNASLDIPASFTASTADSITFEDGQSFSAVDPNEPPILQINVTPGLQYGSQETEITNQGSLETGQNLTLGAYRVDLSGDLEAGRDIILQGQERFLSEAAYTVGGYLFTQDLTGAGIDLLIPHENVIIAEGDVTFEDDYIGPSLYVLAGGQVSQSEAAINIEINETTQGSVTGNITDGLGALQALTVFAKDEQVIDIRSGVNLEQVETVLSPALPPVFEGINVSQVQLGNNIRLGNITNSGGSVNLFSQGKIEVNDIDTSIFEFLLFDSIAPNGGDITLISRDDIVTQDLNSSSTSLSVLGEAIGGSGGNIRIQSGNNIASSNFAFTSDSRAAAASEDSIAGRGGAILIESANETSLGYLGSTSRAISDPDLEIEEGVGRSLGGGDVVVVAGSIEIGNVETFSSVSVPGDITAGEGGNIVLDSRSNVVANDLDSSSLALSTVGNITGADGGLVSLSAADSIEVNEIDSSSDSGPRRDNTFTTFGGEQEVIEVQDVFGGNGGEIRLSAGENIQAGNTLNAGAISTSGLGEVIAGNAGNINIVSEGTVSTSGSPVFIFDWSSNSTASSGSGDVNGGDGGEIVVSANEGIDIFPRPLRTSSTSSSAAGEVIGGRGGNIILISQSGNVEVGELDSFSDSSSLTGNVTGKNAGDIYIESNSNIRGVNIFSFSIAYGNSIRNADAGDVTLLAKNNVDVSNIFSISVTGPNPNGDVASAGDGGSIILVAEQGSVNAVDIPSLDFLGQPTISSFSLTSPGFLTGDGGDIDIMAADKVEGFDIATQSSTAQSGTLNIQGFEDFSLISTNVIASRQLSISLPFIIFGLTTIDFDLNVDNLGNAGNINISSLGDIDIIDSNFQNNTSTLSPSGDISITSPGWISINNSVFNSDTQSAGQAGSLRMTGGEGVRLVGANSQLLSRTISEGDAGTIAISSPEVIVEEEATISTSTTGSGLAGSILIGAENFTITEGSEILAFTSGEGNGGSVIINATEAVNLGEGVQDFAPIISVEASGAGRPGSIQINTPNFVLSETARITATATETATNPAGGGSITLSADQMDLAGTVGIFAETEGAAPGGVLTLQPYQANQDLGVTLAPGAVISASTSGSGNGGNLRVLAPDRITISGPGLLAVETSGSGQGGSIEMIAQQLNLLDDVTISASTTGDGRAGDMTVNADGLTLQNGARVVSNTSGSGQAGDITFNLSDSLTLENAAVEAATEAGSTGDGGSVSITANQVTLDNGRIAVTSQGQGRGGDIALISNRADLSQSQIIAETLSSDGGSLNLTFRDLLFLRNRSLISTTAGTAQAGGNGGNITIDNADGFIIAFPTENSDITANAFEGNGGNISITTRGLFGIEFREQLTPLSDITASSRFGLSGTVSLSGPDTSAIENSLNELSGELIPPESLTAGSCIARSEQTSGSFVVTGPGGLPQQPSSSQISAFPTGTVRAQADTTADVFQEPEAVYQLADGRLVLSHACN